METDNMQLKGTVLVKIASIFIILGGVLNIVLVVSSLTSGLSLNNTAIMINAAIAVVIGLIYIVCGGFSLRHASDKGAVKPVINRGILLIAVNVIDIIYAICMGSFSIQSLFVLAMPVLMIVGAIFNKKDTEAN